MITRRTVPSKEYCMPEDNMTVDMAKLNEPTLAILCGISKEKGKEHYMIFPTSVNVEKFKQYLTELREKNQDDKICLFLDNLSSHRAEQSQEHMKALGFKFIYNMPYRCEYNPIELYFSIFKRNFESLRAKKLAGLLQDDHHGLVHKAFQPIQKQKIVNCVNHVEQLLK